MPWQPHDTRLRQAAFQRVMALQRLYDNAIPWAAIAEGFVVDGQPQLLAGKAEGIYKPAGHPAVLSVRTIVPRRGRQNPYSDTLSADAHTLRYAYRARGGPDNSSNRAIRMAMAHGLPIIYFAGLRPGVYSAVVPMYVVGDDRGAQEFALAPGELLASHETASHVHSLFASKPERHYAARTVLQRLHQRSFRVQVLEAYRHHCAMCSIHFAEFLDAAHIVPDSHQLGVPDVRNGMALCGLHHKAFDRFLVDVDDDYRIQLSPELLRRRNGPIFQRAFLERHQQPLALPRSADHRPGLEFLQARRQERPPELWGA